MPVVENTVIGASSSGQGLPCHLVKGGFGDHFSGWTVDSDRDTKIFEEAVNPTHDISLSDWIIGNKFS